jgi:hypothetical protein
VSEINCNEWIQVIVYIFFRDMETQLAKHLFLSLCNLENLVWRCLTVDKLDTRLALNLRVGFDVKEGVYYSDFISCLCVCLDICLCYQRLHFLCYVSGFLSCIVTEIDA